MYYCEGKISLQDDNLSFLAESFKEWIKEKPEQTVKSSNKIYLRFDTTNKTVYNNVVSILKDYPGDDEVTIKCTNSGMCYKISLTTSGSQLLENDLIGLLGEDNVKLVNGEEKWKL